MAYQQTDGMARDEGVLYVEILRVRAGIEPEPAVARSVLPMHSRVDDTGQHGAWMSAGTQPRFYLPFTALAIPRLAPDATYAIRIALDRRSNGVDRMRTTSTRDVAIFTVRTTSTGDVWPY